MLKRLVKKLLSAYLNKHLPPPSTKEDAYLSELRADFCELPVFETTNTLPSERAWQENMNCLRSHVLNHDPREFLRWDVIANTMFIDYARYISTELKHLKRLPDWIQRWHVAIKETSVGNPTPWIFYRGSSGNLIHHAYHLAKYEEIAKVEVHNMDYVFEFGGGYGSMCRLFYNLGFHGRYVIFDLPPFSALQRYYLKTIGYPVKSVEVFEQSKSGIVCISDILQLQTLLSNRGDDAISMAIATWSLSETPIGIRSAVLPLLSDFQSYLIGYQDSFGEVNNVEYFNNWRRSTMNIMWKNWSIKHIPGNNYLVGSLSKDGTTE